MKKVAILQSNYIPWKGYFDMIAAVDEFILYDDVQFTKNDWRNRNKIKTINGTQWLTIPVGQDINRKIKDVAIANSMWQKKHWGSLVSSYHRSPYFKEIASWLEPFYFAHSYEHLSTLNREFIQAICDYLKINTLISSSNDYTLIEGKTARLADLCIQAGASQYISGPSAKHYIDESVFADKNIELLWFNYEGYREYPQLWGEFRHNVSILDLLFNCGRESPNYMRYVCV